MNAGLADGTTTGDLVLQQAKIVPQTQHFFDFSYGQSLLGHSVSPLARGEIPIGCPAPLSAPTQKARSRNVNINPGSNPPLSSRFGLFTSPESLFTCPESLFTSSWNLYSHRPGIGIHMPRNTHSAYMPTKIDEKVAAYFQGRGEHDADYSWEYCYGFFHRPPEAIKADRH